MTNRRDCILFTILLVLFAGLLPADSAVGTVSVVEGEVFIDAFATGDFIPAVPGEVLYEESVVKTGYDSRAVLDLDDRMTELPPETTLSVSGLVKSRERKKRFRWLRTIAGAVKAAFETITGGEEEVVLGGRAADVGSDDGSMGWIIEDEDEDAFAEALGFIEFGEWAEAVALLREIVDPLPGTFLPGEIDYWIGHCQYQLENYGAAADAFADSIAAARAESINFRALPYFEEALFQSGSSLYFTGRFAEAAETMAFLVENASELYSAFSYLILIDALRESGSTAEARRYLEVATERFADTEYAADFAALADEIG